MPEDTPIPTVPRDRQLANGRWACPICTRDFATRKIARAHVTKKHEGLRWPCESKHTRYITSSTTVPRQSDARGKVLRVKGKSKPWRCPNSCGKRFMKRSGLSRHLREACMENDDSVLPKACSPEYTPVVSVRLQMKRLLGEKVHNNYDKREISRSNSNVPEEKHMTRDSTPYIRQSDIMLKLLDPTTSTDDRAISSIIVSRDSTTFNIKRILFKDAHDPRQPDYVQLYPSARDTRGRVRCARAILCNQTTVSDEHAPSDKPSSYEYILPLLFRNLNFSHILDHAQANYGQVSNQELENLRQEGVKRICRYFGRDPPSIPVYTSASFEHNKLESKNSGVRAGTPLLNTGISEPEQSGFSAPNSNSPVISISSMTSSRESLPEDELTRNKKPRLQFKLKTEQVLGVSEVEDLFLSVFRLCRDIKSLNIRIRVLKENIRQSPKSRGAAIFELGDSFISLDTYLDHELQKSLSAWKEASERLDQENRRCREMVEGNKHLEKLYERLNLGILSDCEKAEVVV